MSSRKTLVLISALFLTATANASLCDDLFTYQSGQVMNTVDSNKARVISSFYLGSESSAEGAIKKQVLNALSEYSDDPGKSLSQSLEDTDESSALITIAQSKKQRDSTLSFSFLWEIQRPVMCFLYTHQRNLLNLVMGNVVNSLLKT